jgi:hypothetical protein
MANNKGKAVFKNPFLLNEKWRERKNETVTKVTVLENNKKVVKNFEHKTPANDVFKEYRDLSEISKSIARELIGDDAYEDVDESKLDKLEYTQIRDQGLLFFMSADAGFRRTGLLSLLPAILTGIKLYSTPESETKADALEKIKKTKDELLSKITKGIEAVFKFIYRGNDWRKDSNRKPVFDASPYESDAFYTGSDKEGLNGRSYIGTISWAIILFLKIIYLVDDNKKPVFDKYRKEAEKLIKWCLSYVNEAVLTFDAKNKNDDDKDYKRPVGWNFSKIVTSSRDEKVQRAQSSLYFTYEAASMYLAIYEEYKDIIYNLQTFNRVYDKYKDKEGIFPLKENKYHINNFKQAEEAIDVYAKTFSSQEEREQDDDLNNLKEALTVLKKCDKRKIEDYYSFNDEKSAQYNGKIYKVNELNDKKSLGSISQLKWNLEKISEDFWEKAKSLLEDNFVYDDFSFNVATAEAIQSGGQTNALFAGLLHISICLYSTYDLVVYYTEDKDNSGRTGKKAYNDMQNTMLLHIQKVQRFFDKLQEKGKEFGTNSLILRFPETFSDEAKEDGILTDLETAEKLRKQLIKITSLTPMLLKTNNLISQYIVKYPQKQMGEAIDRIGQKRFYDRKKDKYCWFWESDGYHAMSNYYYVGAIFFFFFYYDTYEKEFISRYADLRKTLERDLDYTESVQAYYQKKADEVEQLEEKHKNELKAKDDEMKAELAKAKKSEIGAELVSNINKVVETAEYFDKPEFLRKIINGLRKQLANDISDRYKNRNQDEEDLEELKNPIDPKDDSFFSLLQALAVDIILQSAIEAKKDESVGKLKKGLGGSFEGYKLAKVASIGGKKLIKEGLINMLLDKACMSQMNWNTERES